MPFPRRLRAVIPRYENQQVHGLPVDGRCVTITNSERQTAHCDLRWFYQYAEGLKHPDRGTPLRYGDGWHDFMNDLYRWWRDTDEDYPPGSLDRCAWCRGAGIREAGDGEPCKPCKATGLGPIRRVERTWLEEARRQQVSSLQLDEVAAEVQRLRAAAEGYLVRYGTSPPTLTRVVAVEVSFARPIANRQGVPYTPDVPVVADEGGYRFARRGDDEKRIEWVRWPWYYLARLDALMADRESGALWALEHKSSSAPESLIDGLSVDPQTGGYVWLLEDLVRRGLVPGAKLTAKVAGYVLDVASSSTQHDPEPLVKGGYSRAKNKNTPSWRYRRTLSEAGEDVSKYQDHLSFLREHVDPKFYRREFATLDEDARHRFGIEVRMVAARISQMRRDVVRPKDLDDVYERFPRTPVCRLPGGSCSFRGPCLRDGPEVRAAFETHPGPTWRPAQPGDDQPDLFRPPEADEPEPVPAAPAIDDDEDPLSRW